MLTPELLTLVNPHALSFSLDHLRSEDSCVNVNTGHLKILKATILMVMAPDLNIP